MCRITLTYTEPPYSNSHKDEKTRSGGDLIIERIMVELHLI